MTSTSMGGSAWATGSAVTIGKKAKITRRITKGGTNI